MPYDYSMADITASHSPPESGAKLMSIETIVYTLPACWASALINDDQTSLDADEIVQLNWFMKGEGLGSPINVSDGEEFDPFHDARGYGVLPCDCLDYTFVQP